MIAGIISICSSTHLLIEKRVIFIILHQTTKNAHPDRNVEITRQIYANKF